MMLHLPPPHAEPCLGVCAILELLCQVTPTFTPPPPSCPASTSISFPPAAATLGSVCSTAANAKPKAPLLASKEAGNEHLSPKGQIHLRTSTAFFLFVRANSSTNTSQSPLWDRGKR